MDYEVIDRLREALIIDPMTDCWTMSHWQFSIGGTKYKSWQAVHLVYTGRFPTHHRVRCDTPHCVNFRHHEVAYRMCWSGKHVMWPENVRVVASDNREFCQACYVELYTTCKRGHDLSDEANVYVDPAGRFRRCRVCILITNRARVDRNRARINAQRKARKLLKAQLAAQEAQQPPETPENGLQRAS